MMITESRGGEMKLLLSFIGIVLMLRWLVHEKP